MTRGAIVAVAGGALFRFAGQARRYGARPGIILFPADAIVFDATQFLE